MGHWLFQCPILKSKPMRYISLLFSLFHFLQSHAQLNDNIWLFNQVPPNSFKIDFRQAPPLMEVLNINMRLSFTNSSFSDNEGNLIFYSDGEYINNRLGELMENGDSLNTGYWASQDGGYRVFNGVFALPSPGDSTKFYLIYMFLDHLTGANPMTKVHFALIDMAANNGLGKVVDKNIPFLTGNLELNFKHAGAVRHANGRDWWILIPNRMEPKYYRILLTPAGFSTPEVQEIGLNPPTTDPNYYIGPNLFSPDGIKYADYDFRTGVQFFDFDRCTGLLSNPVKVSYTAGPLDNNGQSGVAFSPSGRFAYLTYAQDFGLEMRQYDMQASDIVGSEVLISSCNLIDGPWVCEMGQILLAPNGKIYVPAHVDSSAMHVINKPDSLGIMCEFEYGGFDFPLDFARTVMPYFPNYRLYDVPGSACDTLGIDAPPPPPSGTVSVHGQGGGIKVYPNPASSDEIRILFERPNLYNCTLHLYGVTGQAVHHWELSAGQQEQTFSLEGFSAGMYFWSVASEGRQLGTGKLIVLK